MAASLNKRYGYHQIDIVDTQQKRYVILSRETRINFSGLLCLRRQRLQKIHPSSAVSFLH